MSQEPNLYAAPIADVMDIRQEGEFELAKRSTRLFASSIDGILLTLIWVVFLFIFFSLNGSNNFVAGFQSWASWQQQHAILATPINAVLGMLCYLLLNFHLLKKHGQSVGKKIMGIKIADAEGNPSDIKHILLYRQLPIVIVASFPYIGGVFSIIDPLFIFRSSRKCLHDNIANTIVIKA